MILPVFTLLQVNITPVPLSYEEISPNLLELGNFKWTCVSRGQDCMPVLLNMKSFYSRAFFGKGLPAENRGDTTLFISLTTTETPRKPSAAQEGYTLISNSTGVFISAFDPFGASRALATLAQLITEAEAEKYKRGLYALPQVQITDKPEYAHRAVMYDTARHFLPLSTLKRQIEALALTKMNVIHIHLTDNESVSYSPSNKMARPFHGSGYNNGGRFFYSFNDIQEVAAYAYGLGVFIELELSMPGRVAAWAATDEQLTAYCPKRGFTAANPDKEQTLQAIQGFVQDLIDAAYSPFAKDPLIALGGDSFEFECWDEDWNLDALFNTSQYTNETLWRVFHQKIATLVDIITNRTGVRVYFEDSWRNGNNMTGAVVQTLKDHSVAAQAAEQGIKIIRSVGWDLTLRQPGEVRYNFQDSWIDFYKLSPDEGVSEPFRKNVLGGEALMWGHHTSSGNIDDMVWPRTFAIAEVLWSNPADRTMQKPMKYRFNRLVCVMQQSGIAAGPLFPSHPCPGDEGARFE